MQRLGRGLADQRRTGRHCIGQRPGRRRSHARLWVTFWTLPWRRWRSPLHGELPLEKCPWHACRPSHARCTWRRHTLVRPRPLRPQAARAQTFWGSAAAAAPGGTESCAATATTGLARETIGPADPMVMAWLQTRPRWERRHKAHPYLLRRVQLAPRASVLPIEASDSWTALTQQHSHRSYPRSVVPPSMPAVGWAGPASTAQRPPSPGSQSRQRATQPQRLATRARASSAPEPIPHAAAVRATNQSAAPHDRLSRCERCRR